MTFFCISFLTFTACLTFFFTALLLFAPQDIVTVVSVVFFLVGIGGYSTLKISKLSKEIQLLVTWGKHPLKYLLLVSISSFLHMARLRRRHDSAQELVIQFVTSPSPVEESDHDAKWLLQEQNCRILWS